MTKPSKPQRVVHSIASSRPAVGVNRRVVLILVLLSVIVAVVFGLRAYHLNTYTIPSASMQPGLQIGDRIEIDPTAYQNAAPEKGEVIVFDGAGSFYPYESQTTVKRFQDGALSLLGMAPQHHAVVKRVIGTPGDTVECCNDNGSLLLNGAPVDEPYLAEPERPASSSPFRVEVPDNRVFVLGDNRYDSIDSRALLGAPGGGMIQLNKIYGPVVRTR